MLVEVIGVLDRIGTWSQHAEKSGRSDLGCHLFSFLCVLMDITRDTIEMTRAIIKIA